MNGSINVLHVDDEPPLLDQAKVFLEKEDEKLDVTTVQTPKKALELLEKQDFDVIVSDYQMPDMDGLEFLEKVREERESDIPFIIFTGKGREEVAMKALNLGADQYLQKGGDPKAQFGVLAQVISQEVRHRKAEVALRESEEKYRNLFYEAPVGILHYNDEGVITDCNEVFVEFMGSSKETLLGFNMIEEMENEEVVEAVISSLEEGEGFYEGWYTSVTSSKKKYGSVKFKGLTDEGGDVRSGIGIVEDLSKQKETEDQIKNLNYMLRTIRNINQTIVKEDSLEDVMEKACKILVDNGYILGCSIASMDRNMIRPSIGEGNQLISDEWSLTPEGEGEAPECMKKTVRSQELQMKDTVDCGKCEYKKDEGSRKCVFIPMNSKDKVVGILTVEMSSLQDVTEEQKDLLQEVANDLGLAWEKIRLQKDLEESEEKFRNLAQTTSIAIMVYQDDQWVYANPAAEEISGYSAEEMKDMKFWEFVAPEHVEKVKERGKKRQSDIEALSGYEFKIITKQGEEKWVYLEGASFEYEGESAGLISVMDITEMKKKERMIKKLYEASIELENCTSEKEVYEQVLKSVEDILDFRACTILIEDENDLMVKATKAKNVEEGEKYSKDEGLRGLLFQQKKSYLIEDVSELEEAKTSHPSYKSALSIPIEDEGVFQALSEQKEYFDESDLNLAETLIYYMVQRLKRIRSKDELKRSKERFETLILNAQEGIYIRDLDGTITYVNEKFAEIHGYEKDELIGMKSWELLHPDCRDDTEPKKEYNEKLLEEDKLEERKIKRKDGEVRRVLITNEVTEDYEGNKEIFGLVRDITERKRSEEKRKERETKLKELHDVASKLENAQSEEEVTQTAVDAAEGILEFSVCSIDLVDESGKFIVKAASKEVSSEDYIEAVPEKSQLGGKTFLNDESYLVDDLQAYEDAKPVKDEYRSAVSVPITGKGIFQAISNEKGYFDEEDLKMAELLMDHVKEALERVEMKEREEFLHSLLRHDVQNKTQIVNRYLKLLEENVDLPDEANDYIQKAKKATRASDAIIEKVRKLRQIAKEDEIKEIDIDSVLDQVLSEHDSKLEKEDIDVEVQKSGCKVEGGTLLQETISNLIENSIKHSDRDKIRIKDECEGDECVITIEDDGKGIPNDIKEKIFERGFKEGENAGSGLGMYLVKEIVESYDGSVEVKDSDLGGARFDVHLQSTE